MEEIDTLIERLLSKKTVEGCAAMERLKTISLASDAVYPYLDRLIPMLENGNSHVRTRAIMLLTANARWDQAGKLEGCIDALLDHVLDVKPITARKCIEALPEIAKQKPALIPKIQAALTRADPTCYPNSMAPLVEKDILNALRIIAQLEEPPLTGPDFMISLQ